MHTGNARLVIAYYLFIGIAFQHGKGTDRYTLSTTGTNGMFYRNHMISPILYMLIERNRRSVLKENIATGNSLKTERQISQPCNFT